MARIIVQRRDFDVKYGFTYVKLCFTLPIQRSENNDRQFQAQSFKHKGLRQLFEDDTAKGLNAEHVRKLRQILGVLHAAETVEALRLPTFGLHPLKGELKGLWAVTVRANWRVVFRFEDGKAFDVDLVDYH
jgi:proteic killer suppression protein